MDFAILSWRNSISIYCRFLGNFSQFSSWSTSSMEDLQDGVFMKMRIEERRGWLTPTSVPLMVLQDQKLHEHSKSYQELEDIREEYFQIKSRLEDFVQSRRISNIPEPQESENPRMNISSAPSNVPAKEGNKTPKERRGSADPQGPARPTPPPWRQFAIPFPPRLLQTIYSYSRPRVEASNSLSRRKDDEKEGQQLEESRGSRF